MSLFAELVEGVAMNIVIAEEDFAADLGLVGPLDGLDPQPGIGWSYDASTATWTAPTPPPLTAQQQAQVDAADTIAQLQANQGALLTQMKADIASAANWGGLTATEQGAIIGRILSDGLANIQQALAAQVTLYPPNPPAP